jgi:hypothetical protein
MVNLFSCKKVEVKSAAKRLFSSATVVESICGMFFLKVGDSHYQKDNNQVDKYVSHIIVLALFISNFNCTASIL